jgi:hypothetical protein
MILGELSPGWLLEGQAVAAAGLLASDVYDYRNPTRGDSILIFV